MRVRVVLVGTEGEVNLGSAMRVAANFGVDEVYLVSPRARVDDEEAIRYAAHAKRLLATSPIVDSLEEALSDVDVSACTSARSSEGDVIREPVTPRELARIASGYSSIAVVFGRESVGLTREEISKCDILVTIPANPEYPVLNLTHAMAVVLYELWLARRMEPPRRGGNLRGIRKLLPLVASKLLPSDDARRAEVALKHVLVRAVATPSEVSAIYKLFKRIARSVGVEV